MDNPQANPIISPQTIYQYDHHINIPWNMLQYQPVRQYLDPVNIVQLRKYAAQKKGQKDNKYITKKGFYMDYHIKIKKVLPAPSAYKFNDDWKLSESDKKMSTNRKLDSSLSKYTYLDRIQIEEKNRSKPAPGAYNLNLTDAQIKEEQQRLKSKKIPFGEKRFFYQDTEYLANVGLGVGSRHPHNPHHDIDNSFRVTKQTHKDWIVKHEKEKEKSQKKHHGPHAATYRPMSVQYQSFQRILTAEKLKGKDKLLKTGFGTDTKFYYDRPNKKKIIQKRPDPNAYNTMIQWKGKGIDAKKNNWIRSRSTGFSQSVYN